MSAIPSGLHYEQKPAAIPVYRRRCITNATSSNAYLPLQTIKIPLDTAMHGSVLDTKQTMLQFNLQIRNTNPFVDYINFGRAGANGIISAFRFMVNGNPVEKVTEYAEKYEDMMIKLGLNGDPYEFFQSNPFIPEDGPCHTNFIKPPMVDIMGNTMYRPHMLLDEASSANVFFGRTSNKVQVARAAGGLVNDFVATPALDGGQFVLDGDAGEMSSFSHHPAGTFKPDSFGANAGGVFRHTMYNEHFPHIPKSLNNFLAEPMEHCGTTKFHVANGDPLALTKADNSPILNFAIYKECDFADGVLATKRVAIPSSHTHQLGYSTHTPAEWPYFIPKIKTVTQTHTNKRLQDVTRYYSNCKNIPVGMRANLTAKDYLYPVPAFTPSLSDMRTLDLNIVIPLLSGILGLGADKMFPDMLIAPGKAWLEIDLQDYRKAFYVTMDPCRRVPGTIRDYVPYTGTSYNSPRFLQMARMDDRSQINLFLGIERMLPMYADVPRTVRDLHGTYTATYNAIYLGDVVAANAVTYSTDVGTKEGFTLCYNANACKGIHYMVHPSLNSQPYEIQGGASACTNVLAVGQDQATNIITFPASSLSGSTFTPGAGATQMAGGANNTFYGLGLPGTFFTGIRCVRGHAAANVSFTGGAGNYAVAGPTDFFRVGVENQCNVGGIPIPQYVPVAQPWIVKDGVSLTRYVSENESCYGTYLKQAVAQSSRTVLGSMNNPPSTLAGYDTGVTSYTVSNVELITEQILLPDAVTSQVLDGASAGAITYHTTFIGSVIQQAVESTSQNQILTVTGASVNNLTLLFRSGAQTSGEINSQAYNSLSFYNPFASVEYDATSANGKYDVGGKYTIQNSLSSKKGSNFNLQLKIGNEFIPRTPIRDLTTLLMENEKGVQTIADYTAKLPYHCPMINTTSTNSNTESFMDYAVLENGFLAAFIPLDALDDQTITGNPFFAVADYDIRNTLYNPGVALVGKKIAGTRCQVMSDSEVALSGTNDVGSTYVGTLNKFTPLDGTFHMCFNLDTFVLEGGSARCGTTIVNNQLFLQCQGMNFMTHKIKGQAAKVDIIALWQQDAKIVFEAGGNCISYI